MIKNKNLDLHKGRTWGREGINDGKTKAFTFLILNKIYFLLLIFIYLISKCIYIIFYLYSY